MRITTLLVNKLDKGLVLFCHAKSFPLYNLPTCILVQQSSTTLQFPSQSLETNLPPKEYIRLLLRKSAPLPTHRPLVCLAHFPLLKQLKNSLYKAVLG